jgi:uncharacterized membrane protein YkoI
MPTNLMIRKAQAKFLLVVALCLGTHYVFAQKRSVSYSNPSPVGISLGQYTPRTFKLLNALPEGVRVKAVNHLTERLGNDFYSRLKFVGGSSIDVEEYLRMNPGTKWKVHSYELVFRYADSRHGLKEYHARIRLDSDGEVIEEIDLPEISKFPQKASIISVDAAADIAKSRGFEPKTMSISIRYDEDAGSLVWIFEIFAREDRYTSSTRVLVIDAHSGQILKDGFETGIK